MDSTFLFFKHPVDHDIREYQEPYGGFGKNFDAATAIAKESESHGERAHHTICSSPPAYASSSSATIEAMTRDELLNYVTFLHQSLQDMDTAARTKEKTIDNLQGDISTLEYENERLCQAFRRQLEDANHHRTFYHQLAEATKGTCSKVAEIQEEYMRSVDIKMFVDDVRSTPR